MKTGVSSETGAAASEVGAAFRLLGCVAAVGVALAAGDGAMAGKRPDALPAPISWLDSPLLDSAFRAGIGPSGSTARCEAGWAACAEPFVEFLVEFFAEFFVEAAVTAVVSAAAGGVHFAVVTTLAVAVSFTEVTDVAPVATGIWACRVAGWFVVTELMLHEAVPSPLAQPLLNVGFWLDGCAVSATVTSEADPLFSVVTWIT